MEFFGGVRRFPHVPRQVANYLNLGRIGSGSFAQVFLFCDLTTQANYACKVYSKKNWTQTIGERIEREIRIMEYLDHSSVVKTKDIIYTDDLIYHVMEYCRSDLYNLITRETRLDEFKAYTIFSQILAGLQYIHSRGIVHRDIKPENILVDEDLIVKITDFGLCHEVKEGQRLMTPCGSPFYAAPEILSDHDYDGKKVDVWSLGVLLYAMCAGNLPWESEDTELAIAQILAGTFSVPNNWSDQLKDLIQKMLTPNEEDRPTVEEIMNHDWIVLMKGAHNTVDSIERTKSYQQERKERLFTSGRRDITPITKKTLIVKPELGYNAKMQRILNRPIAAFTKRKSLPVARVEPPREVQWTGVSVSPLALPPELTASRVLPPYIEAPAERRNSCF